MSRPGETAFDQEFCQRFRVCLTNSNGSGPVVWISDKTDISILSYVSRVSSGRQLPVRISDKELQCKIGDHFGIQEQTVSRLQPDSKITDPTDETKADSIIVREINSIILDCIRMGASDIHFEPGERELLCRRRLDGMLLEHKRITRERIAETLSRIKIMSGLDIAEKRRPQDGRIRFSVDGRTVDIRVSIIPTDFGEKAVLRLLDKQSLRLDLKELGFSSAQLELFVERIAQPNGIILVTGPTGSGKTTTLYAVLQHLKSPTVNISTVEDPIEYNLEGINQTQVKPDINLTFAAMLRAILRQDPNIIMIGEIRDRETLDIAIQASLTGHLVLSTVHTNSAVATVTRLLDMGAEPYLLASSLKLIVAQRLVRKLCPQCLTERLDEAYHAAARKLGITLGREARGSNGCSACGSTGYRGRTAIYELLPVDKEIGNAINNSASEQEVLTIARRNSFQTMAETAASLIDSGISSPIEILRELGS